VVPAQPADSERPVFAATSDARPRALRLFGRFAAGLVGLWLVALVMGAFGFGHVPGIQLPQIVGGDSKSESATLKQPRKPDARAKTPASLTGVNRSPALTARRVAAQRDARRGGTETGPHQTTTRRPSSSGGATQTPPSSTATPATPAAPAPAASSPAPQASPTAGTTPATTHTPPGSSSSTPGSRSNAGSAPGRDNSSASPTPGAGNPEHGNPHG
jgi:hypothetical protein